MTHGPELHDFMGAFFGEPAHAYDFIWLRTVPPGHSFDLHCDYPFFRQNRDKIYSTWIPFCDVPMELGPLLIFEGTSTNETLIEKALATSNVYPPPQDRMSFAEEHDTRFLTGDIQAGDVLVFSMFTWHGSFDNESVDGRIRISCDTRYLPQSEPRDKHYVGDAPTMSGTSGRNPITAPGGGYGCPGQWFSLSED